MLGVQFGYSPFCVEYADTSVWLILCSDLLPLRLQPAQNPVGCSVVFLDFHFGFEVIHSVHE